MARMRVTVLFMAALMGAALTSAGAETKYKACSRLTAAELGAALNGTLSKSQEADIVIPSGPNKGATMSTCNWAVGRAYVNLNIIPAAKTPEQRAAGLAGLRQIEEGLRQKGWTVEPANFPDAECNTFKPPASENNALPGAACAMVSGGLAFWLGVNGSVTAQQVKALADKVAARLP